MDAGVYAHASMIHGSRPVMVMISMMLTLMMMMMMMGIIVLLVDPAHDSIAVDAIVPS
jgi:hypothetical protein